MDCLRLKKVEEKMKTKKVRMACIMLCILLVSIPCLGRKKPKGYIYVDKPEVFTRERLINERLEERSWLYKQLNNYVDTIQGYADMRSFKGLFAGIQAAIDTVSGLNSKREQQLADKEQEIKLDNISKQKEISDLNHELEVMKLRQQIKELNGNNSTSSTTTSGNTSSQSGGANQGEEGTESEDSTPDWKTNYDNLSKINYPNPSDIVQSLAKLTSVETLKDQKSYRDQVRAMMRETELDDVHEINGATIYTMKFDVTIDLPQTNTKNSAKLELVINPKKIDFDKDKELYKRWIAKFYYEVEKQAISMQGRLNSGFLSEKEIQYIKEYYRQEMPVRIISIDGNITDKNEEIEKIKKKLNGSYVINSVEEAQAKLNIITIKLKQVNKKLKSLIAESKMDPKKIKTKKENLDLNKKNLQHDLDICTELISNYKDLEQFKMAKTELINSKMKAEEEIYLKTMKLPKITFSEKIFNKFIYDKYISLENKYILFKKSDTDYSNSINSDFDQIAQNSISTILINFLKEKIKVYESNIGKIDKEKYIEFCKQLDNLILKIESEINNVQKSIGILKKDYNNNIKNKSYDLKKFLKKFQESISSSSNIYFNDSVKNNDFEKLISNIIDGSNMEQISFPEYFTNITSTDVINLDKFNKIENIIYNYESFLIKLKVNKFFLNFIKVLHELEQEATYVYVVEPKEYTQNLSVVEANEKITSMMFTLNAIFQPAGFKGNSYLNYIKKNQEKMQGILRKPLVVGYADSYNKFGWLLGPRFHLDGAKKIKYSFSNVQYSLQTSLVVPCWYEEISITKKCKYANEELIDIDIKDRNLEHIRLSPDISLITSALLCREGVYRQPPEIEPHLYSIKSGEVNLGLHISGNHLWKNPVVFIGNQKTEDVKVMPDMKSIYAVFDKKFSLPKEDEKEGITMDLTVITSDGTDTLKGGVKILPPNVVEAIPQEKPIVKLLSRYTYLDGDLKFMASAELIPKNKKIKLQVRKKNGDSWITCTAKYKCHEPKDKFVEIIFSEFDAFSETMEMNAILEITNTDSEKTEIFPIENSFIYFSIKQKSEFKLKDTTLIEIQKAKESYTLNGDIEIEFDSPALFCKAYPDMTNILNGNLSIQFITATRDDQNKRTTIELKNSDFFYFKETEKAQIRIEKGKINSNSYNAFDAIVKLINPSDPNPKDFSLKICLNDNDSINVNGILKLKLIK